MNEIESILVSWQFLLVGGVVFLIFGFFNGVGKWPGLGHYLWQIKSTRLRRVLQFFEAVKVLFLPLLGFGLGLLPAIPRPEPLQGEDVNLLSVALVYSMAGLCSMWIVKFVKKTLDAKGIDVDMDFSPREQRKYILKKE